MAKTLDNVLTDLEGALKKYYSEKKAGAYLKHIKALQVQYKNLEVAERHQETYTSLCKRGVELMKAENLKDELKLRYFLRYCDAAWYDFKDNINPLNWLIRAFMVTTMFFYLITPQYFGFVLPLIMVVPIYIGLTGMKKRSLNGLITGCAIVPLSLMVGTIHFRNIFLALNTDYATYIANQAASFNLSVEVAGGLMTTINTVALIMMAASIMTGYVGIKYRKMFI